jgi:hypothetical protein
MLKIQKEIDYSDKVMELHNFYREIWYKLGLAYDAIGYRQKAKEYFHRMEIDFINSIIFLQYW